MVKITAVGVLVLLCAIPVMAQDDFPRIQTSLGYANLNLIDYGKIDPFTGIPTGAKARHSGFANETGFNFTKNWGVNNYFGVYSLGGVGSSVTLITDMIGGKAMYRTSRVVPYGTAGVGFAYSTASICYSYYGCGGSLAARYGGGVDVPMNDFLGLKFEVSRMSFHLQTDPTAGAKWNSGINIVAGVVITLAQ
jgi:opacity protein-like surface antigen